MISNAEGNSQCHPVTELSNERTDCPYEELLTLFVGKICVPRGLAAFMQAPTTWVRATGRTICLILKCHAVCVRPPISICWAHKGIGYVGLTGNVVFEHVRLHPCWLLLCSWTDRCRGVSQISCTSSSRTGLSRSSQSHPANLLFYYLE